MSNDGNKSTNRAPFTIFSSSADGGYLEELHTNFTGGVTIANSHTDTYGNFRNPPLQGPFTRAMVGGEFRRHQPVRSQGDALSLYGWFEEQSGDIFPISGATPSGTPTAFELSVGDLQLSLIHI